MITRDTLTPELVREFFSYSYMEGVMYYKPREPKWFHRLQDHQAWNKKYAGKRAEVAKEYRSSVILYKVHYDVSKIVWTYVYGAFPPDTVDHIDGDKRNNRIENLRLMPRSHNCIVNQSRVREMFTYDEITGDMYRLRSSSSAMKGDKVGSPRSDGYLEVSINGKHELLHRLAWLYYYGEWPENQIDHINGNRSDNRICNLRDVTNQENSYNIRKVTSRNKTSKYLGVCWDSERLKWKAQIRWDYRGKFIGRYDTEEEAYQAYLTCKRKYHHTCTI